MRQKLFQSLGLLFSLVLLSVVLWVLRHELQEYRYHDIFRHMEEIPIQRILLALVLTTLNYLILTGHDVLAFRYLRYPLSYSKIALASFLAYAFSHNVGFAL